MLPIFCPDNFSVHSNYFPLIITSIKVLYRVPVGAFIPRDVLQSVVIFFRNQRHIVCIRQSDLYRLVSNHLSTLTASPHLVNISNSHLLGTFPNLYVFTITSSKSSTSFLSIVSGIHKMASS